MNKNALCAVMVGSGETQDDLAKIIGISLSRLNAKINGWNGAMFTQREIIVIKKHYKLTAEQVDNIFFAK
ncbi:MAG: XRE family transcriptional regulator [Bacillota bacterium]|jgi:DNA-binding XRE family transcriptional regulator